MFFYWKQQLAANIGENSMAQFNVKEK